MVWPTLGSRTAKEQNRTVAIKFTYSSYSIVNTLPVELSLCQLSPESFKTQLNSFSEFNWSVSPDFLSSSVWTCTGFIWNYVVYFCCTVFSIRICLLSRGAILLEFELAPPLNEERLSRSNTFKQKAKHQFSPNLGSGPTTFEVHGLLGHSKPLVDLTN